jgi:hypothetical protein
MSLKTRIDGDILMLQMHETVTVKNVTDWALRLPIALQSIPQDSKYKLLLNIGSAQFESHQVPMMIQYALDQNFRLKDKMIARAIVMAPSEAFEREKAAKGSSTSQYYTSFSEALVWLSNYEPETFDFSDAAPEANQ